MGRKPVRYDAHGGKQININVDDEGVNNLIEAVWRSVSGPSLEEFLDESAHPFLTRQIENRFSGDGDSKSGPWKPLEDSTLSIKEWSGALDPTQPNVRTGEFYDFITTEHDTDMGGFSAEMRLPGDNGDPLMDTKLERMQKGSPASENPLFAGPTPPREVLAVDSTDLEGLLIKLAEHIIISVGLSSGASFMQVSSPKKGTRSVPL